jgi:hypothetical protein
VLAVFIPEPMRLVLVIDGLDLDLELVARTTRVRGWQAKFKVPSTESSIVEVCLLDQIVRSGRWEPVTSMVYWR